jgi:hypothetical protein
MKPFIRSLPASAVKKKKVHKNNKDSLLCVLVNIKKNLFWFEKKSPMLEDALSIFSGRKVSSLHCLSPIVF